MNSTTFQKTNILGKTLPEMEELLINLGQKSYRAKQILKWIHQRGISNFDEMTCFVEEYAVQNASTHLRMVQVFWERDKH